MQDQSAPVLTRHTEEDDATDGNAALRRKVRLMVALDGIREEREDSACDLCGSASYDLLFEDEDRRHPVPGRYRLVKCRRCEHIFLSPAPDSARLALHYPDEYSPHRIDGGLLPRLTAFLRRREARRLARLLPERGDVLEIGCGVGDLLVPLRDLGLRVVGIDTTEHAVQLARRHWGLDVREVEISEARLQPGSFDAVIMRYAIEHVASPSADLRQVARLLKPGGLLFITTCNTASLDCRLFGRYWYGYDLPRHLNLFSARSLCGLVESSGLVVDNLRFSLVPTNWLVSSRYWLEERVGKSRLLDLLLSQKNLPLLALLLPLSLVQRRRGNSGRMTLTARRPD
jgi:2-polyprenyl-3-methyl-5-hydroxy-6-metoxy-1,4-benzoquinol methylase